MEQMPVQDAFEQQYINETLDLMRKLNEKYADFYHFKVLTMVPMQEEKCQVCIDKNKTCVRLVVEGHKCGPQNVTEQLIEQYAPVKVIDNEVLEEMKKKAQRAREREQSKPLKLRSFHRLNESEEDDGKEA